MNGMSEPRIIHRRCMETYAATPAAIKLFFRTNAKAVETDPQGGRNATRHGRQVRWNKPETLQADYQLHHRRGRLGAGSSSCTVPHRQRCV